MLNVQATVGTVYCVVQLLSVCVDPVLCRLTERRPAQVSAMQLRRRTLRETQVLNTGWVKKISCCTVIDISKARQ